MNELVSFTKEEVMNISILIEAGARSLSSQNKLTEAGSILSVASGLIDKVQKLVPVEKAT